MQFKISETPPAWSELRAVSVHRLSNGEDITQNRQHPRERILMTRGRCQVRDKVQSQVIRSGQFLDIGSAAGRWQVLGNTEDAEFIRLSGIWGDEIAGCGVWTMDNVDDPIDRGDPCAYPKTTTMDRHYHDYDEFWFILEGAVTAVIGDRFVNLESGDCLATPAGVHHDIARVGSPMRGAFFETSTMGARRMGHLWEHTHGPAPGSIHFQNASGADAP